MIIILNLCYYTDVLGVGGLTNHLSKHHRDVWETYVLKRDAKKTAVEDAKKSEQQALKMLRNPGSSWLNDGKLRDKKRQVLLDIEYH